MSDIASRSSEIYPSQAMGVKMSLIAAKEIPNLTYRGGD